MASMEVSLKEMMAIDGALGAVVVDYNSGMALGSLGGSKDLDLQVAAAGNTEVVKAKLRTMESLGLKDTIEDILITLTRQYHVIRPITGRSGKGSSSTSRSTAPGPTWPWRGTICAPSRRNSRSERPPLLAPVVLRSEGQVQPGPLQKSFGLPEPAEPGAVDHGETGMRGFAGEQDASVGRLHRGQVGDALPGVAVAGEAGVAAADVRIDGPVRGRRRGRFRGLPRWPGR
nr:hypothetical protein GCM10020093_007420 [Planobispora longispora]